jgi:hypothetical protein
MPPLCKVDGAGNVLDAPRSHGQCLEVTLTLMTHKVRKYCSEGLVPGLETIHTVIYPSSRHLFSTLHSIKHQAISASVLTLTLQRFLNIRNLRLILNNPLALNLLSSLCNLFRNSLERGKRWTVN